jgi:UDP-N-acetylmuramate: L-alanyl-gamma-D-glutamyl-meso-diaminopimelate ligase
LKYHLIAIGGTGMGALAGLLRAAGHDVRGSDNTLYPPMSDQLRSLEIPVFEGFSADNLGWGPEVVVVGNVCGRDHVEVVEAQRLGLPLASLPQVLGEQFLAGRHSVVVAGTHGKTTTSALLTQILIDAGRDPGCFIGGVPIAQGKGWRAGQGPEFVVEGDEYDSAFFDKGSKFLHYRPHTAVITSIELDHVDIFASMEGVRETFRKFVRLLPADGLLLVAATSDEAVAISAAEAPCRVETYVVDEGGAEPIAARTEAADPAEPDAAAAEPGKAAWRACELEYTASGRCRFALERNGELFGRFESMLVGAHNVGNIVAAVALAHSLGVGVEDLTRSVSGFAGVRRRLEIRGIAQGVYVLDDYAHHPTAVRETLRAVHKRFPGRRVVAIYEPRSATSRRKTFQREFLEAFAHADAVVVGRLFDPSRIREEDRFDAERLAFELHQGGTPATYLHAVDDIVAHTVELARPGDVVVVLSSGSFDGLHDKLLMALGDPVMPARRQDIEEIRGLLRQVGLGPDDVREDAYGNFLVLRNENGFVGCVGLEVSGEDAILRSLAVNKDARGVGYGWLLADTVINVARARGVRRLYLLTDTASDFFAAKHGFRVVDLSTVGPEVASSSTFQSHRDNGHVAMRLDL